MIERDIPNQQWRGIVFRAYRCVIIDVIFWVGRKVLHPYHCVLRKHTETINIRKDCHLDEGEIALVTPHCISI